MKKKVIAQLAICLAFTVSCKNENFKASEKCEKAEYREAIHAEYELLQPKPAAKAVLILFGGYSQTATDIKREFKIFEPARSHGIAVLYPNYNQKLWLEENEKEELAKWLKMVFENNQLSNNKIYFGGFSSGGNVALLIASYLTENAEYGLVPKGVFVVDSPVDLAELYFSAEKNVKREFSEVSVQESNWLLETLGNQFGNPHRSILKYQQHTPFTLKTDNIDNIISLKEAKIRLYTEPDTLWWKENRMADYEQTNAYHIKKLSEKLKNSGFKKAEYIPTENKGHRANGERHPHSWSIVDREGLINWVLDE